MVGISRDVFVGKAEVVGIDAALVGRLFDGLRSARGLGVAIGREEFLARADMVGVGAREALALHRLLRGLPERSAGERVRVRRRRWVWRAGAVLVVGDALALIVLGVVAIVSATGGAGFVGVFLFLCAVPLVGLALLARRWPAASGVVLAVFGAVALAGIAIEMIGSGEWGGAVWLPVLAAPVLGGVLFVASEDAHQSRPRPLDPRHRTRPGPLMR